MKTCTLDGCFRRYYAKGFCNMHYKRNQLHGDPLVVSVNREPPAECSVPGCGRPHASRGLCAAHRDRQRRTGDIRGGVPVAATDAERFWAKVIKIPGGCWEWQGTRTTRGHGQFGAESRVIYAHRFAYERTIGELPDDLVLHHRCNNPPCVNPAHLQTMTQNEHAALHHAAWGANLSS